MGERAATDDGGDLRSLAADARQSPAALEIRRGTVRLLAFYGMAAIPELPLANGRRADLAAVSASGEIWIVEIKSSVEDFRSDQKWPEYRDFSDRLLFAVSPEFPAEILPVDAGLIIADRHSGELIRPAPETRLAPARRKAMTLRMARFSALRQCLAQDPQLAAELGATRE